MAKPSPIRKQLAKQPQPRTNVCGSFFLLFVVTSVMHLFSCSSVVRSVSALGLALTLSACGSGGLDGLTGFMGGSQNSQPTPVPASTLGGISVDQLRADQLCPSIVVRDGTETLRSYAGEERNASTVRYQSQILDTVVECTPGAGQFGLSIGVAGRSLIGPQGEPATLDLPIRIVVLNTLTDEVVSSQVIPTSASIAPGTVSASFSLVNRDFFVPTPSLQSDYQILVGFDDAES